MRDFPVFTTQYGVAGLTLKEIPYRGIAYIRLHESLQPRELLEECVAFCRACGADTVCACGDPVVEEYTLYTAVLRMQGSPEVEAELVESLFPVTEQTAARWREVYNQRMRGVDNAATLEKRDEKRLLESDGAYFVHRGGELLGIGWMEGEKLLCIASVQPGMGKRVMHTLLSAHCPQRVELEVASTNTQAIRFYESLGFVATGEINRWFLVK